MIPLPILLALSFSTLICVILPVGLFLLWRKRHGLKLVPALVGAVAFYLFVMVLEALLHSVVLRPRADGTIAMLENPALYIAYASLAAGVFEETARFISFKLLGRKYTGLGTALSYGIGHGGIEAILLVGIGSAISLVPSLLFNAGIEGSGLTPESVALLTQASPLPVFLGGMERVIAIAMHISLSVLVWHAAARRDRLWLYPLATALHAALDVIAMLFQTGILRNQAVTEALAGVFVTAVVLLTVWLHRKLEKADAAAA